MGIRLFTLLVLSLMVSSSSKAQMSLQRYFLESVGFEYISQSQSDKRCVQWRDIVDKTPMIQYQDDKPFVVLEIEARIEGKCPLNFANGQALDLVEGQGAIKVFRFKVTPPSIAFVVSGPGFTDQLIFEALMSRPPEVGFFKFFERSQTRFDLGYGRFSTSNQTVAAGTKKTADVLPIVSGLITIPFPWYSDVQFGFSLSQNLTNLLAVDELNFQFSEFALDVRYFLGSAHHAVSLVGEMRGRNWYQLNEDKVFVVRSSPGFGLGVDYDGWFSKGSDWGYSLSSRYGFRSTADADFKGEIRAGGSLNYRFSPKWALGVGYKWSRLLVDFSDSATQSDLEILTEQSHLFNVSLLLLSERGGSKK